MRRMSCHISFIRIGMVLLNDESLVSEPGAILGFSIDLSRQPVSSPHRIRLEPPSQLHDAPILSPSPSI